jgi:hypothetical protein
MNLVIIPSVLRCIDKDLSYTKIRSVYNVAERYEQIVKTIHSVREKIPNAYIVLLECSKDIEEYEKILSAVVDEYINYYNNTEVKKAVESLYKGYGESVTIYTFLKTHLKNKEVYDRYENIIKISGRYYLNERFDYTIFVSNENIFRFYQQYNLVTTRLYKINKHFFERYIANFTNIIEKCLQGESVESTITHNLPFKNANYLGVSGYIAVTKNELIDE